MPDSNYTIRNYRASDFASVVRLLNEAQRLAIDGNYLSPQTIRESLERPNYSPERDLFLVETSGVIVGYLDITPETGIGRVILDCFIQPEHRRKGLATRLFNYASKRAREIGVKVIHVNVLEGNIVAQSALVKLGFRSVRRFHELRLELDEVSFPELTMDSPIRHFQPGEEAKLTEIQNRSFAGAWGYNPNTLEEVTYWASVSSFSPEDVVLTCDGDKVIGYCVIQITGEGEAATGQRRGRISMLGVNPDYRGRGVGRRVLLAGLAHLKSKGPRIAELTVDSENEVACALYRSMGFKVHDSSLWYEKTLD